MGRIRHERIVSDPDIMMGKPTIKGTRITVELILEELGEGLSVEDVLDGPSSSDPGSGAGGPAVCRGLPAQQGQCSRQP